MKVHYSSEKNSWPTPKKLFDELNKEYLFDLDPCATHENALCPYYYTKEDDGLSLPWIGTVFMNPPYGREIGKWVIKAHEENKKGCCVVCLLPARTDTAWFHDYCLKHEVIFLRGRLCFGDDKKKRAPFPSCIVVMRGR